MLRRLTVALALLASAACTPSQSVPLSAKTPGVDVRAAGELTRPDGAGPFPAVVVLHGCAGVTPQYAVWAQRLNRWGYVAFVVDSFGPRGVQSVCNTANVPPLERARDALVAAAWLRTQPFVDPARVGVIGFSHGGSTVLKVALQALSRTVETPPFRAAVAYYPGCARDWALLATDTLILVGDADPEAPLAPCRAFADSAKNETHTVELKVYRGAGHLFEAIGLSRSVARFDSAAAEDSFALTRQFLDARLK